MSTPLEHLYEIADQVDSHYVIWPRRVKRTGVIRMIAPRSVHTLALISSLGERPCPSYLVVRLMYRDPNAGEDRC